MPITLQVRARLHPLSATGLQPVHDHRCTATAAPGHRRPHRLPYATINSPWV